MVFAALAVFNFGLSKPGVLCGKTSDVGFHFVSKHSVIVKFKTPKVFTVSLVVTLF
jgi:hypothetical protein